MCPARIPAAQPQGAGGVGWRFTAACLAGRGRVGHRREGGAGGGSIHGGLAAGGGLQVVAEYCCLAVGCNGGSRGTVRWCLENPTFPQLTQAGASGICLAMERS